ncbi:MAG TPA: cytochrome c oxidase subunit II [Solirubrobacteraceae bacterium]
MILTRLISTRHEYDTLFAVYVPIAAGVFVVIVIAIAAAVFRYRRRPPEKAARWSEHNGLEAGYALLLTATVAFLLYLTFTAEHRVDTVSARERPDLTVDVTGAKWEWQFTYPSYGIVVRSGTVGHQPLVVPINEAIRFRLASQDVIHSLWIPELRFKRALIPGATENVTLTFTRAGTFPGQCAEFCGLRHADMVFTVRALSPGAFADWARAHARGG